MRHRTPNSPLKTQTCPINPILVLRGKDAVAGVVEPKIADSSSTYSSHFKVFSLKSQCCPYLASHTAMGPRYAEYSRWACQGGSVTARQGASVAGAGKMPSPVLVLLVGTYRTTYCRVVIRKWPAGQKSKREIDFDSRGAPSLPPSLLFTCYVST